MTAAGRPLAREPQLGHHTLHHSPMFGGPGILDVVLAAAVAAGFSWFGVDHATVAAREPGGSGELRHVRQALDAGGVRCSDVAVVSLGSGVDDGSLRGLAAIARALDAPVVIGGAPTPASSALVLDDAKRCAEVFAESGARLGVEFTAYSEIRDLQGALDLCDAVGWEISGVVVDSLHFFRSGAPWDVLRELRADQIVLIQWSDAREEPTTDPITESRHHRLVPGAGSLPLKELAMMLQAIGSTVPVVAEVLSGTLRHRPPGEVASTLFASMRSSGWS